MKQRWIHTVIGFVLVAGVARLARADEPLAARLQLPPDFEEDPDTGRVEGVASRIVHKPLALGFRLIPAGQYRIGDPKLKDSSSLDVRLSAYYVAESELTYSQVATLFEKRSGMITPPNDDRTRKNASSPDDRIHALERLDAIHDDLKLLSHAIPDSIALRTMLMETGIRIASPSQKILDEDDLPPLSDAERKEMVTVLDAIQKQFTLLKRQGSKRFDRAHYATALACAEELGCGIPTEAQWEVAAARAASGTYSIDGMLDDLYEWCADHYSADYFQRKTDLVDPVGPSRGRLSPEQAREEAVVSETYTRWVAAASLRVLRGGSVSKRSYGRSGGLFREFADDFSTPKGIRLAVSLNRPEVP